MTVVAGLFLFIVSLLAANISYLSERILFIWTPAGDGKHGLWRVLELILLYLLCIAVAASLEARSGSIYPQGWQFYAITASLFVVMGYPGFVLRYLVGRDNGNREA